MSKLNITNCKAATYIGDGQSRYVVWDDEIKGFGLRVYPTGRKAFILSYRCSGKKHLYTIGDYGTWTPDQAKKEARKLIVDIEKGHDPKAKRKANSEQKPTFSELHETYISRHLPQKKRTRDDISMLAHYIPKLWNNRELKTFSRDEIIKIHQNIGAKNGHFAANRLIALLRKMFNLAVDWGLLPEGHPNPCSRIKAFHEKKRERFIRPEELPRLWASIQEEPNIYWRGFFILNLLLGTRRGELLSMRFKDLDLKAKIWYIPDTKPNRSHYIPLPIAAVEILNKLPRLVGSPWVFPSWGKSGHLTEPKKAWARIRDKAGLEGIRIHDLRRTVGSWLAAQGESLVMIGKVLNHSQPSTTAIYAKLHLDPVRQALEKNAELMLNVIAGDNSH